MLFILLTMEHQKTFAGALRMYMTRNVHINVALRRVHVTISAVEQQ